MGAVWELAQHLRLESLELDEVVMEPFAAVGYALADGSVRSRRGAGPQAGEEGAGEAQPRGPVRISVTSPGAPRGMGVHAVQAEWRRVLALMRQAGLAWAQLSL